MNPKEIIQSIYGIKPVIPFEIKEEEIYDLLRESGHPVYGEIPFESFEELLPHIGITEDTIFYDLGSGYGKLCMQVFLTTPARKIVGVEYSPTRFEGSRRAKNSLSINTTKLEFIFGNMLNINLSEATHIFMCSTAYGSPLLGKMVQKFIHEMKSGSIIISLAELPLLEPKEKLFLPMSWGDSDVFIYCLL